MTYINNGYFFTYCFNTWFNIEKWSNIVLCMSLWTQLLSYKLHIHSVLIALTLKRYFTQKWQFCHHLLQTCFFFLFCWTQIHILNNVCVTKHVLLLQYFFILHIRRLNCLFTKTLQKIIFCVQQKWEIDSAWGWVNDDSVFFRWTISYNYNKRSQCFWSLIGSLWVLQTLV